MNSDSIPVIDIRHLRDAATLRALDEACSDWGFFQVVNHGIEQETVDRMSKQAKTFFAQPMERKRSIARTAENSWGFYDKELTKNTRDWKQIYDYGPADGGTRRPQWPAEMPEFRASVLSYYSACESLAFRLLSAMAANLGVPSSCLTAGFVPSHTSFLRLNYYPKCPAPERPTDVTTPKTGHLGLNHHTDAGTLTLLLQDEQPGLEVYREEEWHLVEARRGALVVNVGDVVQVWSNDRYQAALHRVLANETNERYSVPFFFCPAYGADYAPLATMVDDRAPARYRRINWGEFYRKRTAGDYANHGKEVQISDYRI